MRGCRKIGKKDMKYNYTMPKIHVDPEKYEVKADGVVLKADPAAVVAVGQAGFVF